MMSVEKLYEWLVSAGTPLTLPGPWRTLPCDPSFFRLGSDPTALLETLQSKFEAAVLKKSGVVRLDEQGVPALNPLLASANEIVWALRTAPNAPPFNLVANLQSIEPTQWSFYSTFHDHQTATMLQAADDQVAVAFTMTDLAILRSLKIPATPAHRLLRMLGRYLDVFCQVLHIERKTSQALQPSATPSGNSCVAPQPPLRLSLFDWSVEQIGQNDSLQAGQVWKYFGELQKNLGLELYDFQRLKPSEEDLARFRFIVEHGPWENVREAVLEGPYEQAESLLMDKSLSRPLPSSLSAAVRTWRQTQTSNSDVAARKEAWSDIQDLHDQQLFDQLMEQAKRTTDPTERILVTMLADMNRLLHPQMLVMAEKLGQAIGEQGSSASIVIPKDDFQQVMAVADRVLALTQGIHACRKKKPFQMIAAPRLKPTQIRSEESGSRLKKSPPSNGKGL